MKLTEVLMTAINFWATGSYFGEIGCIYGGVRSAAVKAITNCELQALSRRNLNIILTEYPAVGHELRRVANERIDCNTADSVRCD